MKPILYILSIIFLFSSCGKDKTELALNPNNIKWKAKLDDDVPIFGRDDPIIYKDFVIQKVRQRGKLIAFNKFTGEEVWRWTDGFDKYGIDGFSYGGHIFENLFITGQNNLTVAIDLDTGKTIWEDLATTNGAPFIRGLGNKIVKYDFNPEVEYFIRLGNASTGEFETIHHWEREDDLFIGNTLPLIFEWENIEYVVWSQIKWGLENGTSVSHQFLHLYNLNERQMQWVSDTIKLDTRASGTAGLRPKFYDGHIYLENDAIYSYDVENGSLAWRILYDGRFDGSRLTLADGKIFGNNDNKLYMVALDSKSGSELWRTPTANQMSQIVHHDDKIYIAGGLNNEARRKLFIFDANTGVLLLEHKLESHDLTIGQYARFLTVDSTTGLVYAGDHENLICLDFEL